jgi:serine/threonine protein phosphatase 1
MMGPNYEQAAAGLEAAVPDEHFKFFALLIIGHDRKIFPLPCWRAARNPAGAPKCVEDLLWIRDEFLKSRADFGRIVVHGHTPSEQPEILPNRINVDTGAFAPGRLTCGMLESAPPRFLMNGLSELVLSSIANPRAR